MNEDQINYTEETTDGGLSPTPDFYRNLGNLPSPQRLREMDVKIRVPYITEFLEGKIKELSVPFKNKYSVPPLCLGLILKVDGKCTTLYPDGRLFYADTKKIYFNTLTGELNVGDQYKLRVYNLDL